MNAPLKPDRAFIFAAGMGKRLRPYTDTVPKPMVPVAGRTLIDRILDHLQDAGVAEAGVNTHYKADVLQAHLRQRESLPRVRVFHEQDLLDTGGGLRAALPMMDGKAFYAINGDAMWTDGPEESALLRLARAWDPRGMDLLLLLMPVAEMSLTHGNGDYRLDTAGRPARQKDQGGDLAFAGVRIVHPRLFDGTKDGAFSFLELMDRAEARGRLAGLVHDSEWHHISTPEDLENVESALAGQRRRM